MSIRLNTQRLFKFSAVLAAAVFGGLVLRLFAEPAEPRDAPMKEFASPPTIIPSAAGLTEEEWRARLSPEAFRILRQSATERPFGEIYEQFKHQGTGSYYCAGCGSLLFSSAHKFDSHCGWPSFYDPAKIDSVKLVRDESLGMVRTEVVCATCGGHLGHLFKGEGFDTPTDQRFCINGYSLVFVPQGETPPSKPSE